MVVVLVVSILRKVDQSEWDCSMAKQKEEKLATVRVGHFSLEKWRLKTLRPRTIWRYNELGGITSGVVV